MYFYYTAYLEMICNPMSFKQDVLLINERQYHS